VLADEQEIIRYADIRAYTNQAPTPLEVVASDDDPRITTALGEEDYRRGAAYQRAHEVPKAQVTGDGGRNRHGCSGSRSGPGTGATAGVLGSSQIWSQARYWKSRYG
jgi:hypothetical protein